MLDEEANSGFCCFPSGPVILELHLNKTGLDLFSGESGLHVCLLTDEMTLFPKLFLKCIDKTYNFILFLGGLAKEN